MSTLSAANQTVSIDLRDSIATNSIAFPSSSIYDTTISTSSSHAWEPVVQDSLIFNIKSKEITFEGDEIIRLKEMLTEWIQENHPEDLL